MSQQMLLDWFSGPVMTELAQSDQVAPGLPKPFPTKLYDFSPTECVGVNVMYESVIGVRQTGKVVDYLSPAATMNTQPRTRNYATALGSRISTPIDSELIIGLQSNVPMWQQRARTVLMQMMRDFRQYTDNLFVTLIHSAFSQDAIYVDRDGNILPNATGAVLGNNGTPGFKFNSLYAGANSLTSASHWPGLPSVDANLVGDWSSDSFDIPASLRAARQGYIFTSNYNPMTIIYGKSVPTFMYENTAMQTYMSRQPQINQEMLLNNEVPAGMLNFQWVPGYMAYYLDANGVQQPWVDDDQIIILPDVTPGWYENILCSMPCPTGVPNASMDIDSFIKSCPPTRGYSSYVIQSLNPIKLDAIAQGYSFPTIKSPYAVWSANVKAA